MIATSPGLARGNLHRSEHEPVDPACAVALPRCRRSCWSRRTHRVVWNRSPGSAPGVAAQEFAKRAGRELERILDDVGLGADDLTWVRHRRQVAVGGKRRLQPHRRLTRCHCPLEPQNQGIPLDHSRASRAGCIPEPSLKCLAMWKSTMISSQLPARSPRLRRSRFAGHERGNELNGGKLPGDRSAFAYQVTRTGSPVAPPRGGSSRAHAWFRLRNACGSVS